MYVLDTNVVSELRKAHAGKANPNVVQWANSCDAGDMFLSSVSVLELEIGVLRIERRDRVQGALLRRWLDDVVLAEFVDRVLSVDTAVARRCAALHVPDRRNERDALIAATAQVHGMTVVTRNVGDFRHAGVTLLNPFASAFPR